MEEVIGTHFIISRGFGAKSLCGLLLWKLDQES